MTEQEMQLQIAIEQGKVNTLRQEVAEMNKEREYWQHYHIQAAIAAMQGLMAGQYIVPPDKIAVDAVRYADALIAELQKKGGQDGK